MAEKEKKVNGKAGRPFHEPTQEQRKSVKDLSACHLDHAKIARFIGICKDTLYAHYTEELETGESSIINKAITVLSDQLDEGNLTAAIFVLKCRARWRETDAKEDPISALTSTVQELKASIEEIKRHEKPF